MNFRIGLPAEPTARELSQKVLQATALLNMYHAELARVLGMQCADIGALSSGRTCLQPGTKAWEKAVLFIRMYNRLHDRFNGDSVAMINWMRRDCPELGGIPHIRLVDYHELARIEAFLATFAGKRTCPSDHP